MTFADSDIQAKLRAQAEAIEACIKGGLSITADHLVGALDKAYALGASTERARQQGLCKQGTCNPYIASCGAEFCDYEEMLQHQRACADELESAHDDAPR